MSDQGSRNPDWGRDETILALDLYLRNGSKVPDKSDEHVRQLSDLLRRNPLHAAFASRKNFRSPSAVVLKLGNLQQEAEGRGMPNNSKVDKAIWREFGSKPDEVSSLARSIELTIAVGWEDADIAGDDFEFFEGQTVTRSHLHRERNPSVRLRLLSNRQDRELLHCEICYANYSHLPMTLRRAAFEAHHLVPLAKSGPRSVRIADMALLCASCHRLIHRLIADHKSWVDISEARRELRQDGASS